ncbi:MAG: hypothetical protein IPK85_25480 [Gemmatimonadetes bacterium]|nr:hypothetical protein [Gemmatimonadota bacterium]
MNTKWNARGTAPVLLGALLAAGACRGIADPPSTDAALSAGLQLNTPPAIERPQEEWFQHIAREVPTFAGFFYDKGDLVVSVTDLRDTVAAFAAVAKYGPTGKGTSHPGLGRTGRTRGQLATWTLLQLATWRDALFGELMELDEVEFLDLDEHGNRVLVGVGRPEATATVLTLARRLAVPMAAVGIDTTSPMRPQAGLSDRQRPIIGGLEINEETAACTLGFITRRAGVLGFVTNSHCTSTFWALDGVRFLQGSNPSTDSVGVEVLDPRGWACGFRNRKLCRYSDAAIIGRVVGPELGTVAQPEFLDLDGAPYSTTIDPNTPTFEVTSNAGHATWGDVLDKVGRTTGWTRGEVRGTCVDMRNGMDRVRILCQDLVTYNSDNGDSGAPVFVFQGAVIRAHGLNWGSRERVLGGTAAGVSPMANMTLDLGAFSVATSP